MRRILFHENSVDGKVGGSHQSLLLLVKRLNPAVYEKVIMFNSDMALRPEFEKCGRVIIWKGLSTVHFAGQGVREGWDHKFHFNPQPFRDLANFLYYNGRMFYSDIILGLTLVWNYYHFLKRENIHILHLNNSFDPYWNMAAALRRIPIIQHVRGIGATFYPPFCHLSTKVICISEDIKEKVLARGIAPRKVVLIYNAVDFETFRATREPHEVRARLGIKNSERLISLFGNIQQWKGQETLVKACIRLKKKYNRIRCVLFGDIIQEDYARQIRHLVENEKLGDTFLFAGYTNEVANWMNASDVVVHASVQPEPFGRVLIEAMAIGKPIIGADIGAVPEIIENTVSGLLFEPGNDEQLANRIDFLLSHPNEARRLGKNGQRRVRTLFNVQQQMNVIERLYEDVLHPHAQSNPRKRILTNE
jgi:glycosyltransferase involved in cell wall biosynthesis